MFKTHDSKTGVYGIPKVLITAQALDDMWTITDSVHTEVGWLCTAQMYNMQEGNVHFRQILIDSVHIPDQQVHATTTELTPEGMGALCQRLMDEDMKAKLPPDQWRANNIRAWFH